LKHIKFTEGNIVSLIKKRTKKGEKSKFEIAILLENGSIYNNIQQVVFADREEGANMASQSKLLVLGDKSRTFTIAGKILKTAADKQKNEWFHIMVKDLDSKVRLFTLHYDNLYEIENGLLQALDGKLLSHSFILSVESTNLVQIFCPTE
jgi:hypothetical protein